MNPGGGGFGKPRSRHSTPAWRLATEQDAVSKTKTKTKTTVKITPLFSVLSQRLKVQATPFYKNKFALGTIQDGPSITARDCSSQSKCRELEDATLSDKFWSLTEQKIPSGGITRVASVTLVAGAAVSPAPRRGSSQSRVNRAGSPSDRGLEDPHGSPARLLRPAQQL